MNTPKLFRYPFTTITSSELRRPILPCVLATASNALTAHGLVDSGADVNILPLSLGVRLGVSWDDARIGGSVGGAFGRIESRYVRLGLQIGSMPVHEHVFLWLKTDDTPLLFGMADFFMQYDVCFFLSRGYFEIHPKQS